MEEIYSDTESKRIAEKKGNSCAHIQIKTIIDCDMTEKKKSAQFNLVKFQQWQAHSHTVIQAFWVKSEKVLGTAKRQQRTKNENRNCASVTEYGFIFPLLDYSK